MIPCHELSGGVASIGFGASGLSIGDEIYGISDWYRDGAAAEFIAVEARTRKPARIDHVAASTLPLAGLTAWQALFVHGHCKRGDTVLVLGAAGGVGALALQLARRAGARIIGQGRPSDRQFVLGLGATEFVDLVPEPLSNLDDVSLVLDTVGGETLARCLELIDTDGRTVVSVEPSVLGAGGTRGVFFVVEPDRATLAELARLVDTGELKPTIGQCCSLSDGRETIEAKERGRVRGKVSIAVAPTT